PHSVCFYALPSFPTRRSSDLGEAGESGESGEAAETGDDGEAADCAGAGACLVLEDSEVLDCCGAGAGEAAETAESGETAETVGAAPAEDICSTAGSWCAASPAPSSSASASRRDPASAPAPSSAFSPCCTAPCSPRTSRGARSGLSDPPAIRPSATPGTRTAAVAPAATVQIVFCPLASLLRKAPRGELVGSYLTACA